MKKLFSLTLAIVLVFSVTGCSKPASVSSTSNKEKYGYYTFENFDWGMSKQECLKLLGVKENETLTPSDSLNEEGHSYLAVEKKVFGYNATVSFDFYDDFNGTDVGLASILIKFDDKKSKDKIYDNFLNIYATESMREAREHEISPKNEIITQEFYIESIEDKALVDKMIKVIDAQPEPERALHYPISEIYVKFLKEDDASFRFNGVVAAILNTVLKTE